MRRYRPSALVALAVTILALTFQAVSATATVTSSQPHVLDLAGLTQYARAGTVSSLFDIGQPATTPFVIHVTWTPASTGASGSLKFRQADAADWYRLLWQNGALSFQKQSAGATATLAKIALAVSPTSPLDLTVTADGSSFTIANAAGATLMAVSDASISQGYQLVLVTNTGAQATWTVHAGPVGNDAGPVPSGANFRIDELMQDNSANTTSSMNSHQDLPQGSRYTLDWTWAPVSGAVRGWVVFREQDSQNFYQVDMFSDHVDIARKVAGTLVTQVGASRTIDAAHPAHLRLLENGVRFELYDLDSGALLIDWTDPGAYFPTGKSISLYTGPGANACFDSVVGTPG